MDLRHRKAEVADLAKCENLVRSTSSPNGGAKWLQLGQLWASIVRNDRQAWGVAFVIEDEDREASQRLVAFCFSAFAGDEICSSQSDNDRSCVTCRVADRLSHGAWPLLGLAQVAEANASCGLNLLILSYGRARSKQDAASDLYIRDYLTASFLSAHAGYNIQQVLAGCRAEDVDWAVRCGFRVRDETHAGREAVRRVRVCDCRRKVVPVSLSREEALEAPGTLASFLFVHKRPRFLFRLGEQELLREALAGKTDEEMSYDLNVTLSTVKKRWIRIYDEVISRDSSIFPHHLEVKVNSRGAEKRRHLLEYLRRHPEELCPHAGKDAWAAPPLRELRLSKSPARNLAAKTHGQ